MERLIIAPTETTPAVSFDHLTGIFEISGKSFPEKTWEFYERISKWLDEYVKVPLQASQLSLRFDYVNTSSQKCIIEIASKLGQMKGKDLNVSVIWLHDPDDEEMFEIGENLNEVLDKPMTMKPLAPPDAAGDGEE